MPADLPAAAILKELPATGQGPCTEGSLPWVAGIPGPGGRGSPRRHSHSHPPRLGEALNSILPRHNLLRSRPLVKADLS